MATLINSNRTKLVFVNNGIKVNSIPPPLSDMCAPVRPLGKSLQTVALQWLKVLYRNRMPNYKH